MSDSTCAFQMTKFIGPVSFRGSWELGLNCTRWLVLLVGIIESLGFTMDAIEPIGKLERDEKTRWSLEGLGYHKGSRYEGVVY